MIKDNQKRFNRLHVVLDALVIVAAYVLSWFLFVQVTFTGTNIGVLPVGMYMSALVFIVPVYLLLYTIFHLFTQSVCRDADWNLPISARRIS